MYSSIKKLLIGLLLMSCRNQAGAVIPRDTFYEDTMQRVAEITNFPRNKLQNNTPIKDLELVHPTIRRDLVEYAREMFFASMDNTVLDRYDTLEQVIDYLYQFVNQPDAQAYYNRDNKTANSF